MPRLVRRAPLQERIRAYLDPVEILTAISETLNGGDWDDFQHDYGTYIAIAVNVIFFLARATSAYKRTYHDDVFGDYEGRGSSGWLKYALGLAGSFMAIISFVNAVYAIFRTRSYRLFEQPIEKPLATKSAHRVRVDSPPMTSSPLRYLANMIKSESAESREHPDATRHVWELRVWDPTPICLTLLCFFSPGHVLVYYSFVPATSDDPNPTLTYVKTLVIILILSLQLHFLSTNFIQQAKDNALIHRQVLHEYDTKFVHPNLHKPVRDVGTQAPPSKRHSGTSTTATQITEVDTYTPTTIINRGFHTHPNPAYSSQYDPDNLTSHRPTTAQPPVRLMRTTTPSLHTPVFPASSTTPATQAEFSSPIRPHTAAVQRQAQQYRRSDIRSGTGDGGSLGVYSHANSPLKKASSSNYLRDDTREGRRDGSPLKRVSLPKEAGTSRAGSSTNRGLENRGIGKRDSGRGF